MVRVKMRVAHGHFNIMVPQELLHRGNIHPRHDKEASKSMPQVMEPSVGNSGSLHGHRELVGQSESKLSVVQ